jgi:hypothetical protein
VPVLVRARLPSSTTAANKQCLNDMSNAFSNNIINHKKMKITDETKKIIFNKLKENMERVTPPLIARKGTDPNSFELIGNTPVPYGSTKKIVPGMYFASIVNRKDSVVFYFFPCYSNPKLLETVPALTKCLKGKTCFHFTKEEQVNEKELNVLLKTGISAWKKEGYIK